MAVTCAKCGRQYDVTLFGFGRTINCACGARVGLEHRLNLSEDAEIRFFADVNVARLVRWLRAAGFDTVWEDAIPDPVLVRRAIDERRFVLTLDKRILRDFLVDHVVVLENEEPRAQFAEVVRRFDLKKPPEYFTRCLACNTLLRKADAPEIATGVPEAVRKIHDEFSFCPNCRKVFWEGSHARRMRTALENVFDG
ncbi:MAG: Mut7-C RNAse domain-containing protein [Acidobacteria bacterium]|nr:Mut7-C RNAse domain-containing protein [Acidobacteriota bacterium]